MAGAARERLTVRLRRGLAVALQRLAASITPPVRAADDLEALRSRFPDAPDEWLALVRRGAPQLVAGTQGHAAAQPDRNDPRPAVRRERPRPAVSDAATAATSGAVAARPHVSFAGFEKSARPVVRFPAERGSQARMAWPMRAIPSPPASALKPSSVMEPAPLSPQASGPAASKQTRPRQPVVRYPQSVSSSQRSPGAAWPGVTTHTGSAAPKGQSASVASVPPVMSRRHDSEEATPHRSWTADAPAATPAPIPSARGVPEPSAERRRRSEHDQREHAPPPRHFGEPSSGRREEHHPTTNSRPSEGWGAEAKLGDLAVRPRVPAFAGAGRLTRDLTGIAAAGGDHAPTDDPWPELPRAAEARLPTAALERARLQKLIAEQEQRGWSGSRF